MKRLYLCTAAAALALVTLVYGSGSAAASVPPPATGPVAAPSRAALNASWAKVLDRELPLAQRQQALAFIEQQVQTGDQHDLYVLGSLYHMGQRASVSPVPQDLDKATLYLGNAAMRGSVLAMAKMAEIKFAAHQYREAMNWAQIYGHYEMLLPSGSRPHHGYAAELVQRILDRLGPSAMAEVMPDVDAFIAAHDAQIRAGTDSRFTDETPHPASDAKPYIAPDARLAPHAGFADYLIAFKADGSAAHAWLLDAVPDAALGSDLRRYAEEMRLDPATATSGPSLRYAWLPVVYDDGRYRMSTAR